MDRFTVQVIAQTPNPQQVIYAAMHQDYAENFVWDERDRWPDEAKAGEIIVKNLLAGNRGHYGPLEHPQIVLNCGWFPHSTMQQIRTHRVGVSFDVQCLTADTQITFVNCEGETSPKLRKTIGELYELWTNGEKAIRQRLIRGRNGESPGEYRRDCRNRLRKMRLRVLNEETGTFEIGHIKDVICSGLQPVYQLTLENAKTLNCTINHRLFTTHGWQTMGEALGLVVAPNGEVLEMSKPCSLMCNGLPVTDTKFRLGQKPWNYNPDALYHNKSWLEEKLSQGLYVDEIAALADGKLHAHHLIPVFADESLAYEFENLVSLCKNCHEYIHHNDLELEFAETFQVIADPNQLKTKRQPTSQKLVAHPVRVIRVQYLGLQMTYDLEVDAPWHNFVANGIVVHNSFRYTGSRIIDVIEGRRDVEEVFYLRPVGSYSDRQGKHYHYTGVQRQEDLDWCLVACRRYAERIEQGFSEEHARGLIPFDVRQHWVLSANVRSLLHLLDLRWKADAQLEAQKLCELIWPHFQAWAPAIAEWYATNRLKKARLAP